MGGGGGHAINLERGYSFTGEDTNVFYPVLFKVEGFFNKYLISYLQC